MVFFGMFQKLQMTDQNMCLFKAIAIEGIQIHYGVFIGMRQSLEGKGEREGERGRS